MAWQLHHKLSTVHCPLLLLKKCACFYHAQNISDWLAKQFICVTNTAQLTILIILLGSWWISYFFIPRHSRVHSDSVLARQLFSFFLQRQHTRCHLFDWQGWVPLSVVVGICLHFVSTTLRLLESGSIYWHGNISL